MTQTKVLDLGSLSMGVLVRIVNELGGSATSKTFSQRSKAVDRILKLAADKGVILEETYGPEGNLLPPPAPTLAAEEPAAEEPAAEEPAAEEPKQKKGESIRAFSERLLLEVVSLDSNRRKVGLSYADILNRIKAAYPAAKTSVACLRWYAVHMRERGVMPPTRPRAVPTKTQMGASEEKQGG